MQYSICYYMLYIIYTITGFLELEEARGGFNIKN